MNAEIYKLMKLHLYCLSREYDPELVKRYPRTFAERYPDMKLWHFDPDISMGFTIGLDDTGLNYVEVPGVIPTLITSQIFHIKSRNKWNAAQHIYSYLKSLYPELDQRLRLAHQPLSKY